MAAAAHHEDDPAALLRTIEEGGEPSLVTWAAEGLVCCMARSGASALPAEGAAQVLMRRVQQLDGGAGLPGTGAAKEAVASLLAALLMLVQDPGRPEDGQAVRSMLLQDSALETGWLHALVRSATGNEARKRTDQGAHTNCVVRRQRGTDHATHDSQSSVNLAFMQACFLVAHVAEGDEELVVALHTSGFADFVAGRLLHASCPESELEVEWVPFATAATQLLRVLTCALDQDVYFEPVWTRGRRPHVRTDALLAALKRSLCFEGGHLVVHSVQLNVLRALGHTARVLKNLSHTIHTSPEVVDRIVVQEGLELGMQVMRIAGADEEAVVAALRYLAELLEASPRSYQRIAASGLPELVEQQMAKYTKGYGTMAVQREGRRLLRMCRG